MSNTVYRILNPALTPPQIVFECNDDEQAALRDYAARHDAHTQGLIIAKSEDGGASWVGVKVRPPDVALPLAAQAAAASAPSTASHASLAAPSITPSVGSVTAGQAASAGEVETGVGIGGAPHSPIGAAGEIDRSGLGVTRAPSPALSPQQRTHSPITPGEVESGASSGASEPHAETRSSPKHRR
ncbi:MAG TPA: hypothetical protein VK550_22120 [Polyangiaceae bacterium]|nr:hypothetical protein [Polyangiaceae bacterium]